MGVNTGQTTFVFTRPCTCAAAVQMRQLGMRMIGRPDGLMVLDVADPEPFCSRCGRSLVRRLTPLTVAERSAFDAEVRARRGSVNMGLDG